MVPCLALSSLVIICLSLILFSSPPSSLLRFALPDFSISPPNFTLHTSAGFLFQNAILVLGLVILSISLSHPRSSEHICFWTCYMLFDGVGGRNLSSNILIKYRVNRVSCLSTSHNLWYCKNLMWISKLELR